MSKTPEQQAQEYLLTCQKEDFKFPVSALQNAFIAGHAAGKQDERSRIWAELQFFCLSIGMMEKHVYLNRIVFGDE